MEETAEESGDICPFLTELGSFLLLMRCSFPQVQEANVLPECGPAARPNVDAPLAEPPGAGGGS